MSTNQRKQLNPIQPKGKNTGSKETGRSVKKEDLKNLQKIDKKLKQEDALNEQAEKDCREAKNVITIRGRGPQLIKSKKNDIDKQRQTMNNLNALEQQEQWLKKNKDFMERQKIESKVKNKNIFVKQNLEVLIKDGIRWKGPIGSFKDMEKLKNKNNQERIEVVEKLSKSLHELYNICTNNNIPITSIDSTYISIIVKILGNDDLKMQNDIKGIIKGVPLYRCNGCDYDNNIGFQVQFAKLIEKLTTYFTEYLNKKYSQQNAGLNKDDKNNNVANINNNNENDIDVHFNDNTYKQSDEDSKEEENIVIFNDNENRNNDIILNNGLIGKNKKAILSALPNKNFKAKLRQKINEFKQHIQGCTVSKITKAHFLKFESLFNGLYQSFITRVNDKNMASTNTTAFIDGLVMPLVQSNLSSVENSEEVQKQIDSIKQQLDESAKNFLDNFTAIDNNEKFHEQFYNFIVNVISVLKTCVDSYDKIISINILHRNIEPIIENKESNEESEIEESENSKSKKEEENKESNEENSIEESKKENEESKKEEENNLQNSGNNTNSKEKGGEENSNEESKNSENKKEEENSIEESKKECIKIDENSENSEKDIENNSEKDIEKDNNIEKEKESEEQIENEQNIKPIKESLTQLDINNPQYHKLGNTIKQNNKQSKDRNIQSATQFANNQRKRVDNMNKKKDRVKSAKDNEKHDINNINNIMPQQQHNNVAGNVAGNANARLEPNDENIKKKNYQRRQSENFQRGRECWLAKQPMWKKVLLNIGTFGLINLNRLSCCGKNSVNVIE